VVKETNDVTSATAVFSMAIRDLQSFEIQFEFESAIRFESDWPIQKFSNRIGHACSFAHRKLSQTIQTINDT